MTRVSQTGQEILNDRVGTRKGYTGYLNDTAADLVYMKARYYDPQIGRFYSNDPVGFSVGNPMIFNRYGYVNANPYRFKDSTGRVLEFVNDAEESILRESFNEIADRVEGFGEMIETLENSEHVHRFEIAGDMPDVTAVQSEELINSLIESIESGDPPVVGSGTIVKIDPRKSYTFERKNGKPYTAIRQQALAHEVRHAYDIDHGLDDRTVSPNGDWPIAEDQAMETGAEVGKAFGGEPRNGEY